MHPTDSRRRFLRLSTLTGVGGLLAVAGHAEDPAPPPARGVSDTGAEFITAETQAAVDRGLSFLARVQGDDGGFADRFSGGSVGVTALAGLALMAGGNQPGRGKHARAVSRAVDYVASTGRGPTPGFLTTAETQSSLRTPGSQSGMYSHGFGALFLSEACGMLPDAARQNAVREVLESAIGFTVSAQNKEGGWRYEPRPQVADVSVTVAQLMALRAARNAGVFVRKSVVDACVKYIRECQMPDGGFSYFKGQGYSAFARTAAAIVGLYSAGIYSGKEIDRGLKYLRQFLPGRQYGFREVPPQHYFYGQYYAALAMWTAGGNFWAEWFPAVRDELLARLRTGPSGVWNDIHHGPVYATAMSCIVLQLPNNYLPILQK